ncbi:MAG: hypothetical protein Q4D19_06645 [Lautropia sp.]|nr:hypothetical protein [Lautropia sp.]
MKSALSTVASPSRLSAIWWGLPARLLLACALVALLWLVIGWARS